MQKCMCVCATVVAVLGGLYVADATAMGPLDIHPTSTAVITDQSGTASPRLLLSFEVPEELEGVRIDDAYLVLYADVEFPEMEIPQIAIVQCGKVAAAWDSDSVAWDYPWTVPGRAWDLATLRAECASEGAGKQLLFNVTDIVQGWVEGQVDARGFVVAAHDGCQGSVTMLLGDSARTPGPFVRIHYSRKVF